MIQSFGIDKLVINRLGSPGGLIAPKPNAAPTDLTLVVVSHEEILLEWLDVASNEEGYSIERTSVVGGGSGWAEIDTVTSNVEEYLDGTCSENTTYYYRIRAFIGGEYSEYTNVVSGTTPPVTLPADTETEYIVGSADTDLGILIVYSATRGSLKQVGEIHIISGFLDEVKSDPLNTFSFDDVGLTVTAQLSGGNITMVMLAVDDSSPDPIVFNSTIEIIRGTKALMGMPDPDYLFETRNGLEITDKIKGNRLTISHFPCGYFTSSGVYSSFWESGVDNVPTDSWTYVFLVKGVNDATNFQINNINGHNQNYLQIYKYGDNQVQFDTFNNGNRVSVIPLRSTEPWSEFKEDFKVFAVSWDNSTLTFRRMYQSFVETFVNPTYPPAAGSTGQLNAAKVAIPFQLLTVMKFSRAFTLEELNALVTGTIPSDSLSFMNLFNNDNRAFDQYTDNEAFIIDPISGLPCAFTNSGDGDDHLWELKTNNRYYGPYNLFYGFTQRQTWQIPYSSGSVKLIADNDFDLECLPTGVIHNLASSYINGNPDNMPMDFNDDRYKIYAIWNKADRTIWKATIETANEGVHYLPDENGNYTLWNPLDELNQDFFDLHAETGHDGHIFVGLRISGVNITGITQIAVYKNNLT